MKLVVQRVLYSSVGINEIKTCEITKGLLVLVGFNKEDTKEDVEKMVDKLVKLRVFEDENGKTNLNIADVDGSFMIVSQFTLCANCNKGTRPSFDNCGAPKMAYELYVHMIEYTRSLGFVVEHGKFGANMKIELVNDGPFTLILP